SLSFNYELAGLNSGQGVVGHLTSGWGLSGTTVYQSGYPAMVWTTASFQPVCANTSANAPTCPSPANPAVGFAPNSGDYNADGDTSGTAGVGLDYPDVSSYHQQTSRSAFLNGAFSTGQFTKPAFGTQGNEQPNPFRTPNFFETDVNVYKTTK